MKHLTLLLVPALALQVSCSGGSPDAITEKRGAVAASTYLPGFVSSVPGSDVNQCMNDAGNMLQRLNARGELLGFQYTHAGYTGLSGSTWHVQGIVRLPFYSWDSVLLGQWFAAAFSHPGGTGADYGAHFGVAQSAHKGGVSGLPLGTNRAFNENWDGNTADWNVTPYPDDSFIPVNGTPKFKLDDTQNHPGGPSALGWHVAVPLQKWAPNQTPGDSQPLVKMYSLWNPDAPVLTSSFLTHINNAPGADVGTDAMGSAIVKLADGRFLLAVNKSTPTPGVEFYVSADTDIESPTLFGAYRVADAYLNLANSSSWQNMTFVVDCNGSLWLLGFRGGGEDWIDLFSIALYGGGTSPDTAYRCPPHTGTPSTCTAATTATPISATWRRPPAGTSTPRAIWSSTRSTSTTTAARPAGCTAMGRRGTARRLLTATTCAASNSATATETAATRRARLVRR